MKPTTDQIIRNVVASLQIEGFDITDETKELLRKVADKEATPEELIKEIVSRYEGNKK